MPERDIPHGYNVTLHKKLKGTIAAPGVLSACLGRMTACHHSKPGAELVCVGWAVNQLGVGNNIGLRIRALRDTRFHNLRTVGPQHLRFEDTLPKKRRRR